jgi:hypothetical protein
VPGADGVAALKELLYRPWQLEPVLWSGHLAEQRRMIELTEQQYPVRDTLNRVQRAAIAGCAGSGKTLLAVEKAVRLAGQNQRVLLTCFNKGLAAEARIPAPGALDIIHFHELCDELAQQAGVPLSTPSDPQELDVFFNHELPNALVEAADRLTTRCDAIVVDEGQDFRDEWWIALQMLLRDTERGTLYIFYNDNQRFYSAERQLPIPSGQHYILTTNCRNTQQIHAVVCRFYSGEERPTALGPPAAGGGPTWSSTAALPRCPPPSVPS